MRARLLDMMLKSNGFMERGGGGGGGGAAGSAAMLIWCRDFVISETSLMTINEDAW